MRNRTVPDGIEQAIRTVMWLVIIVTCLTLTVLMYDTIVVTRETRLELKQMQVEAEARAAEVHAQQQAEQQAWATFRQQQEAYLREQAKALEDWRRGIVR